MTASIGERVNLVLKGGGGEPEASPFGFPAGGRAAALTADGYFLTAHHVVEEGSFYIGGESPGGRRYGRIVWHDPGVDLAVVKFPGAGGRFFGEMESSPRKGERVFTADDEGVGLIPANGRGEYRMEDMVGNGAFFAAGEVRSVARGDSRPEMTRVSTTLVARGGMSGAPLVTAGGRLCGIITRVEWPGPFLEPRTIGVMVEPKFLLGIIEADRRR